MISSFGKKKKKKGVNSRVQNPVRDDPIGFFSPFLERAVLETLALPLRAATYIGTYPFPASPSYLKVSPLHQYPKFEF